MEKIRAELSGVERSELGVGWSAIEWNGVERCGVGWSGVGWVG